MKEMTKDFSYCTKVKCCSFRLLLHYYEETLIFQHFVICLKITLKSLILQLMSEASYVYILSGQKFIKIAKNGPFWGVFENLKLAVKQCYQTKQFSIEQKLVENAKIEIRHLG